MLICRRLHTMVYKLIAGQSDYAPFSNAGDHHPNPNNYVSLESIHDRVHVFVGGNGHMSYVPYSAFDPIFWLHHAWAPSNGQGRLKKQAYSKNRNVDRLFAIWQAIHPESYATPQVSAFGTFTNAPGSLEDITTRIRFTHDQIRHCLLFQH